MELGGRPPEAPEFKKKKLQKNINDLDWVLFTDLKVMFSLYALCLTKYFPAKEKHRSPIIHSHICQASLPGSVWSLLPPPLLTKRDQLQMPLLCPTLMWVLGI